MSNIFNNINEIPVKTWSWLHVNDANLKQDFPPVTAYKNNPQAQTIPAGITLSSIEQPGTYPFKDMPTPKVKEELLSYMQENRNNGYFIQIAEGEKVVEPILLSYALDKQSPVLTDDIFILAKKGSKATILIHYVSEETETFYHSGITRVRGEAGSELTLIKVQMLSDQSSHVDHVAVEVDENAKVQVLLAELGSGESITNCNIDLNGKNAEGLIDSIYLGDKERTLDINYRVTHFQKNTISNIHSRGVMADKCEKVFRGTIDFVSGASGSKGSEDEYTVLLSPDIKNISTPLLLCGEDDVEGAHAVSAGKLDKNMLFYLMNRGLSEADAKKVMVEASFEPVLEKIADATLREQIFSYVRRRLSHV